MVSDDNVAMEMAAIPMHDGNHGKVLANPDVFQRVQHNAQCFSENGMPPQSRANFGIQRRLPAEARRKTQHHMGVDLSRQFSAFASGSDVLKHLGRQIVGSQPAVRAPG